MSLGKHDGLAWKPHQPNKTTFGLYMLGFEFMYLYMSSFLDMDLDAPITQVYAPMMQFILYFSSISFLLLVSW